MVFSRLRVLSMGKRSVFLGILAFFAFIALDEWFTGTKVRRALAGTKFVYHATAGTYGVSQAASEEARRLKQQKQKQIIQERIDQMPFKLPALAAEWCMEPTVDPLPYDQCKDKKVLNVVPLYGGLTNALKNVLLGGILSFEEDRCFTVHEADNEMLKRSNPEEALTSIIQRYFEPIGLPEDDQLVKHAGKHRNFEFQDHKKVWASTAFNYRKRRPMEHETSIPSLGYDHMKGHDLKREMLRRMWRPLPLVRNATCNSLSEFGLRDDFIAISVRRGDKSTENFVFAKMNQYIEAIHAAAQKHFGGTVPKIFVATDDCTVMQELRTLRPHWEFMSECDNLDTHEGHAGFALTAMADWSIEETDAHFRKFFVELYAMAIAKYFIGVTYTNVSWWVYFMRSQDKDTFEILKTPGTEKRESIEWW